MQEEREDSEPLKNQLPLISGDVYIAEVIDRQGATRQVRVGGVYGLLILESNDVDFRIIGKEEE